MGQTEKLRHATPPQRKGFRNRNFSEQWRTGKTCKDLCEYSGLPLFTIIAALSETNLTDEEIKSRLPDKSDPLYIEYIRTVKIHAAKQAKLEKRRLQIIQEKIEAEAKRAEREEKAKRNRERKQAERDRIDAQRAAKVAADFH